MDRKADPQTQLMIDEAILDYLVYTAIKALLEVPEASASAEHSAQIPLQMVGCEDHDSDWTDRKQLKYQ